MSNRFCLTVAPRKAAFLALLVGSLITALLAPTAAHVVASPAPANAKTLQMYFVDVEGGQATLFVTPEGKSLLMDTGWSGFGDRDADRIVAAAKDAGVAKVDFVLLTHYHQDHSGGVPELAAKIPLGTFIDHGPNREAPDSGTQKVFDAYQEVLTKGNHPHIVAKPGDALAIPGIQATVVSADGAVLAKPLAGAGAANPTCNTAPAQTPEASENTRSLGVMFTFGKLRILDLGDLTADRERELMCPANKLGAVDILVVSHHGTITSNSPELLNAIAPRVAIMDNGETKGASPEAWETVRRAPRLMDLWQLHYAKAGGDAHNVAPEFIANLMGGTDAGNYLKLTASAEGSVEVYNARTKATKHYELGK